MNKYNMNMNNMNDFFFTKINVEKLCKFFPFYDVALWGILFVFTL